MSESLDSSYIWFWISAALTVVFAVLLFLATRRRDLWLRCIAAEAAFWTRLGVSARIVEASRQVEVSRIFIGFLCCIVALWFLLALANGSAYLYIKSQLLPQREPNIMPIEVPESVRPPS